MVSQLLVVERSLNGGEVRLLRETIGLTPYALAKRLGVRKSRVLCWEKGEHPIDPLNDQKLRMLALDKIAPELSQEIRRKILQNYHNGFKTEETIDIVARKEQSPVEPA